MKESRFDSTAIWYSFSFASIFISFTKDFVTRVSLWQPYWLEGIWYYYSETYVKKNYADLCEKSAAHKALSVWEKMWNSREKGWVCKCLQQCEIVENWIDNLLDSIDIVRKICYDRLWIWLYFPWMVQLKSISNN